MNAPLLLTLILCPALAGVLMLLVPARAARLQHGLLIVAAAANLWFAAGFAGGDALFAAPWGFGFQFALKLYYFNSYVVLAAAGFGILLALYCAAFMQGRSAVRQFYAYFLFTLALTNGAVLADDLLVLLFFWEGLLLTLFGMIFVGGARSYRTAVKAFVINGVTDLCLMIGIALTIQLAGTSQISAVQPLPLNALGSAAFLLLIIGATSKAGAMPFHSWIPDAAKDAPLPFMALVPAALEKLLGIYFLARITLDLYHLEPGAWVSTVLMIIGACTIVLAVLMALIQKDYKKLLSFHAISQVGYMVLGIGTALPAGIMGGIFHMINHAMYKSCLFLSGGSVEKQTGTTDLEELGGIGRQMPVTCAGFVIAALAISGVFPLNGFFSKELVYEGALERGSIYYIAALLGSFLTAASFLKLGHSAYFGAPRRERPALKEAPMLMLAPIVVLAALCLLFGLYNSLPLSVIEHQVGAARLAGHHFGGMPHNAFLIAMTAAALLAAVLNHWFGVKRSGSSLGAADHIHHAPGLRGMYDKAEQGSFDPYGLGLWAVNTLASGCFKIDRAIDWLYDNAAPGFAGVAARGITAVHNGSFQRYLAWSLIGFVLIVLVFMGG